VTRWAPRDPAQSVFRIIVLQDEAVKAVFWSGEMKNGGESGPTPPKKKVRKFNNNDRPTVFFLEPAFF
jgi:hypothetical protein